MGYQCDFCGEQRAMVYCRSDAACLCLSCDRNVHSANALSKRHSRTLLCERCNSQPAFVRCSEERVSLCQNCDWIGHGNSTPALTHKRQTINCYSGCPSAAELSSIWSFVLDFPTVSESACEQEMGLMSIADMSKNETCGETDVKSGSAAGTSSMAGLNNSLVQNLEEPPGSANNASVPKFYCPGTKSPAFCENDDLYDDFNMDEMDLSLENYDELFGMTLTHAEELFENGGIDSLFKAKDMFAAKSNRQGAAAAEGSSIGLLNAIQPECSNAASADSMMSAKTEPILCIAGRQANPSLSFSNATGDSTAGDYQECDTSILLTGEPPWCPPSTEASVTSASRSKAVMRYKEKKKTRKFDKTVRYASRKARADVRKRVKGRFVKAGDVYDYDPLSPTRSY